MKKMKFFGSRFPGNLVFFLSIFLACSCIEQKQLYIPPESGPGEGDTDPDPDPDEEYISYMYPYWTNWRVGDVKYWPNPMETKPM